MVGSVTNTGSPLWLCLDGEGHSDFLFLSGDLIICHTPLGHQPVATRHKPVDLFSVGPSLPPEGLAIRTLLRFSCIFPTAHLPAIPVQSAGMVLITTGYRFLFPVSFLDSSRFFGGDFSPDQRRPIPSLGIAAVSPPPQASFPFFFNYRC